MGTMYDLERSTKRSELLMCVKAVSQSKSKRRPSCRPPFVIENLPQRIERKKNTALLNTPNISQPC